MVEARDVAGENEEKRWLAPPELGECILLSAGYDGSAAKAYVKLYEPREQRVYLWYDNTGHLPYLISKLTPRELEAEPRVVGHRGFVGLEEVEKYDALLDKNIKVTKVKARDPLSIGGGAGSLRAILGESWESRIRYYSCYIYDLGLVPGMPYRVEGGELVPADWSASGELSTILDSSEERLRGEMEEWIRLLEAPIPDIKRVAVDIEVRPSVANRVPNADKAEQPIIAAAFAGSDGLSRVLIYDDTGQGEGLSQVPGAKEAKLCSNERELVQETLKVLEEYPVVLTFNGDDFDLKYLRNRARALGIADEENPIQLGDRFALLKHAVHIDLYQWFRNRSVQGYAFGNRYREYRLEDIGQGILGEGKIPVPDFQQLKMEELAEYCMQDAAITLRLTQFNDNLVMNLMVMLQRISRMILEDLTRFGVSRWILSLMEWMHRQRGWLIPNSSDIQALKGSSTTTAIIKGKKFQGAIVREPVPGIHFNVAVLDFASLYPSAIRNWNLSYETVRCVHPQCRDNLVPTTSHWVCTLYHGLASTLIGSLRDLRVEWYKPKSKDPALTPEKRNYYEVVQQALKVFLNATYGVFGSESFPLYCPPMAESTAAVGRYAMEETGRRAGELGIRVLYGDTDSVFLDNPSEQQLRALMEWADRELGIDLEVDKVYRYAVFSERKKNYLGVYRDGRVDIKGMTGKKRHIPPLLKKAFEELILILSQVEKPQDFPRAKEDIKGLIHEVYNRLMEREFKVEEVAFQMQLGKSLDRYDTNPQHVKAGRMLRDMGYEVEQGDIIYYVVTKNDVLPAQAAKPQDVDVKKYVAYLEGTFEQVLDALDMSFDQIIGKPQQASLASFFGKTKK